VIGDGSQRWAPVLASDVARAVAAIDDRRDPVGGTWSLGGPEELTADEVFAIEGEGREPAHLEAGEAAERLTELLGVPVSARATGLFAMSSVPDSPGAVDAFGVRMTAFEDGLRVVAAEVADVEAKVDAKVEERG
jgi:hypothetical protein